MKPIPIPTEPKQEAPVEVQDTPKMPRAIRKKTDTPEESSQLEATPIITPKVEETPEKSPELETQPEQSPEKTDMPSDENDENCVIVDGKKYEIKPTKVKYFRNQAASGYGIIKAIPLHELLTYGKGVFDEKRDADQLLYDFLVAAFDDSAFVRSHYDDFDADLVDRVQKIFGRINHIRTRICFTNLVIVCVLCKQFEKILA